VSQVIHFLFLWALLPVRHGQYLLYIYPPRLSPCTSFGKFASAQWWISSVIHFLQHFAGHDCFGSCR